MAKQNVKTIEPGELLDQLERIEIEKQQLARPLQEIPMETQLFTLADISLERETEGLREILSILKKV